MPTLCPVTCKNYLMHDAGFSNQYAETEFRRESLINLLLNTPYLGGMAFII